MLKQILSFRLFGVRYIKPKSPIQDVIWYDDTKISNKALIDMLSKADQFASITLAM